jgi:hypothetical protein
MSPRQFAPRLGLVLLFFVSTRHLYAESRGTEYTLGTLITASGGSSLKSFGQRYAEVRTEETAFTVGLGPPEAEADGYSFHIYTQRTTLHEGHTSGSNPAPLPAHWQSTGVEFSIRRALGKHWQLMSQTNVGWHTAGTNLLLSDGFGCVISALGMYTLRDGLDFAFGAAIDTLAEGSNRLLPALGLNWKISEGWRLSLGLPRTGLFYSPTETLEFGLVAEGGLNTYYVLSTGGAADESGQPLTETKLEYTEGRAGLQVNWLIAGHLKLSTTLGVVGYRRFEYPEHRFVLKAQGTSTWFGSVQAEYRF